MTNCEAYCGWVANATADVLARVVAAAARLPDLTLQQAEEEEEKEEEEEMAAFLQVMRLA